MGGESKACDGSIPRDMKGVEEKNAVKRGRMAGVHAIGVAESMSAHISSSYLFSGHLSFIPVQAAKKKKAQTLQHMRDGGRGGGRKARQRRKKRLSRMHIYGHKRGSGQQEANAFLPQLMRCETSAAAALSCPPYPAPPTEEV